MKPLLSPTSRNHLRCRTTSSTSTAGPAPSSPPSASGTAPSRNSTQQAALLGISRDLDLDYYSVRRYARTENVDELLVKVTQHRTKPDDYKPYIYRRFTEGCDNARQLFREVLDQGLPGERTTVSRYVRLLREGMVTTPPPPAQTRCTLHTRIRPTRLASAPIPSQASPAPH
ncbi:hypothetical protein [Streptomyces halobius]|uniref:Uncharacterized protein n=1 Tax=Streptomyces halobius TaxID=2879846 RepID=A0ABY4LYR5_9ACTN|nr:hypothetical protein [Streptomyces halobius]UQA90621.1 hypothetical protein K9S39_00750 [Streptomyces halobius]